ncbi:MULTISPECIES: type II toxin-antitoxin system HicB family antitoxin [Nitrosococcus]|uniref:HicB n=3 Tax=Nitrosococcus TaxID=1227 RepID=Q3JF80_NITOC|nr:MULTISPECIES: toxin-antitoxin system HicB family antitoxin [Nitrosococcus]KFI17781.1 DNA repair protein [Nitrosococcus oceani C-27]ABA56516.1 HicB [Nitrosococcus oceani ATCC 19707]ADJ29864.1 HicB family protein [Nitrosococcus watsonii C-113]EDZ65234.1 HicB family [Nitrosococcus oceani AFC27]BBM60790.1 toxin-antitoxin system HicB family antitoxin [Nitrosococcus oceani]
MEIKFDGFTVNLYQDEEDDWLAHFVEMSEVSAFADTPEQALNELAVAWEGIKESYRKHGEEVPRAPARKEYSGQFNVRIDKRLHRKLAMEAARAGISLNALVAQKLAESAEHRKASSDQGQR